MSNAFACNRESKLDFRITIVSEDTNLNMNWTGHSRTFIDASVRDDDFEMGHIGSSHPPNISLATRNDFNSRKFGQELRIDVFLDKALHDIYLDLDWKVNSGLSSRNPLPRAS